MSLKFDFGGQFPVLALGMSLRAANTQADNALYDAFAEATNNFQSCISDWRRIYCFDKAADGTLLMGRTSFFRHFRVMNQLYKSFKISGSCNILAAPSSVGCEAYSLAAQCLERGIGDVRVDAFDISAKFTALGMSGQYPGVLARRMDKDAQDLLFAPAPKDALMRSIRPEIKDAVRFLPPQKFEDLKPQPHYDIALTGNLFIYLNETQINKSLDVLYASGAKIIVFTPPETSMKPDNERFCDIRTVHPAWRSTHMFEEYEFLLSMYKVWVRKDAFAPTNQKPS